MISVAEEREEKRMSECMTQEDAMNMSTEQAVQILKPMQMMMRDQHGCPISEAYFALEKAIEALEQKTDAVSVVRCKDCKHWKQMASLPKQYGECLESCFGTVYPRGDFYCADAEREEDITPLKTSVKSGISFQ